MDINSISVLFSTFMTFFIHSLRMLLAHGENEQMLRSIMIYSQFNIILLRVLAIRKKRFVLLLKERDQYDSKNNKFWKSEVKISSILYFLTNAKIENYTGTDLKFDTMTHLSKQHKRTTENINNCSKVFQRWSVSDHCLYCLKNPCLTLSISISIKRKKKKKRGKLVLKQHSPVTSHTANSHWVLGGLC